MDTADRLPLPRRLRPFLMPVMAAPRHAAHTPPDARLPELYPRLDLFLDPAAPDGGDGSREHPYNSLDQPLASEALKKFCARLCMDRVRLHIRPIELDGPIDGRGADFRGHLDIIPWPGTDRAYLRYAPQSQGDTPEEKSLLHDLSGVCFRHIDLIYIPVHQGGNVILYKVKNSIFQDCNLAMTGEETFSFDSSSTDPDGSPDEETGGWIGGEEEIGDNGQEGGWGDGGQDGDGDGDGDGGGEGGGGVGEVGGISGSGLVFHGGSLHVKLDIVYETLDPAARKFETKWVIHGIAGHMVNPPRDDPNADPMPPWKVYLSLSLTITGCGMDHRANTIVALLGTSGKSTSILANAIVALESTAVVRQPNSTAIAEAYGITTAARHGGSTSTVTAVADAAITSTTEIP